MTVEGSGRKGHHMWLLFPSQASIPDVTQKCLLDRDTRLPRAWRRPGPTESNSAPHNTITLRHAQPVKPSFPSPSTDSEPGIQGHNALSKKTRKQASFQRQITALCFPTCPPMTHVLPAQEKAGQRRLLSTDSPLVHASFSLQNIRARQDSRKM